MVRRIVTGHKNGKSVIISDGPVANTVEFKALKGFRTTTAWVTPPVPKVPYDGVDPTVEVASMIPIPGGSIFLIVSFPPDSAMSAPDFDAAAVGAEYTAHLPGLAALFEQEHPGMHVTPTVDYDMLLEGEIWLELDDGVEVKLDPYDVAIQNGTRHGWRNKSDRPATMAFVLIGAATEISTR